MGMKKQAAAIAPYCRNTGRFLLQVRGPNQPAPGLIGFFGGKAENNESPIENAIREFYEETRYMVPSDQLIPLQELLLPNGYIFYTFLYYSDQEFTIEIDQESSDYLWLTPKELLQNELLDSMHVLLESDPILKNIIEKSKNE
jgi:8-oxo-dGTP pyrophosphatase MutT (NUDIX family)